MPERCAPADGGRTAERSGPRSVAADLVTPTDATHLDLRSGDLASAAPDLAGAATVRCGAECAPQAQGRRRGVQQRVRRVLSRAGRHGAGAAAAAD